MTGGDKQMWTWQGNNLISKNGLALEIKSGMFGKEAELVMNPITEEENQQFELNEDIIVSKRDKTCVDVYYGMTDEGNFVWMFSQNGSPAQKWRVVKKDGGNVSCMVFHNTFNFISN